LVIYRQNWGEERVWLHDAQGRLISLPALWTSVIAEDAFVAVSAGRSMFRVAELLELTRLIEELKKLKQREECKGNDVINCKENDVEEGRDAPDGVLKLEEME